MNIKYEEIVEIITITRCPYGIKYGNDIIRVGSYKCKKCIYNNNTHETEKYVECNHP